MKAKASQRHFAHLESSVSTVYHEWFTMVYLPLEII